MKYRSGWIMDNEQSISWQEALGVCYSIISGKKLSEVLAS